jgi:hypothetical protein
MSLVNLFLLLNNVLLIALLLEGIDLTCRQGLNLYVLDLRLLQSARLRITEAGGHSLKDLVALQEMVVLIDEFLSVLINSSFDV